MIISALQEGRGETRVAITPEVVNYYIRSGFDVALETGAGLLAGFSDEHYLEHGASIVQKRKDLLSQANILLCINEPLVTEIKGLNPGALLIAPIENKNDSELLSYCLKQDISVFSMHHLPKITRTQSIDSFSSQTNIAGYRAVLEGVYHFGRVIPMMITAAGMVHPAKIFVIGLGIAGLQAIATAKRLGAVVYAFDLTHTNKEQVQSLGAEFLEVQLYDDQDTLDDPLHTIHHDYQRMQDELIDHYAALSDIVITTAITRGQTAPILLKKNTLEHMKPGSVVVDLAAPWGGNCELTVCNEITTYQGITLIGLNEPTRCLPATASELFANNMAQLIRLFNPSAGTLHLNGEDEIMIEAMLCHQKTYLPFKLTEDA